MRQRMMKKSFESTNLLMSRDTKSWILKNIDLYTMLYDESLKGVEISADVFNDIEHPPRKFKWKHHFKHFQNAYALHDSRKKSIYYDEEFDILYVVPNNKSDENMKLGGINVTGQVHLLWRYVFLKDELLFGQDSEFNIYKSYIFMPTPQKLRFTFLAVFVQILLTIAICYDLWDGWPFGFEDGAVNHELATKMLSATVFILLSIQTNRTTGLYFRFYEKIGLMFKLPWYLLICDFISNIIISVVITLFSYMFLVQSESYSDLVLNSFALTFVAQIDDMVNTFDSDEEVVITQDLRAFWRTDCVVPRKITYQFGDFGGLLWSPFVILESMWTGAKALRSVFIKQKHATMLDMEI